MSYDDHRNDQMSQIAPGAEFSRVIDPDGIPIRRAPAPLARRFLQISVTMVAAAISDAGIVPLDLARIAFIGDVRAVDQRRLSQAMGIDRNSVSSILERLETKGLVERRINGTDKRARELYVTAEARDLQRRFRPKILAAYD